MLEKHVLFIMDFMIRKTIIFSVLFPYFWLFWIFTIKNVFNVQKITLPIRASKTLNVLAQKPCMPMSSSSLVLSKIILELMSFYVCFEKKVPIVLFMQGVI